MDGVWKHTKRAISRTNARCPEAVELKLREAQWRHWLGFGDCFGIRILSLLQWAFISNRRSCFGSSMVGFEFEDWLGILVLALSHRTLIPNRK